MPRPAILIGKVPPDAKPPNHPHDDSTEHFVNRPDIEFKKCKKCGREEYPPGFFKVGDGATVTILWPL